MIHDAVDLGNEVRRQYVPKHIQKPEARKNDEVLLSSSNDDSQVVIPSENTPAATEAKPGLARKKESE